jgi:hypothetical protein
MLLERTIFKSRHGAGFYPMYGLNICVDRFEKRMKCIPLEAMTMAKYQIVIINYHIIIIFFLGNSGFVKNNQPNTAQPNASQQGMCTGASK